MNDFTIATDSGSRKYLIPAVAATTVMVASIFTGIIVMSMNKNKTTEPVEVSASQSQTAASLSSALYDTFAGDPAFTVSETGETSVIGAIPLAIGNAEIKITRYTPGFTYRAGTGDYSWTVDLDRWVAYLGSLAEGKQRVTPYSAGGLGLETEITAQKIGNHIFEVTDGYFPPTSSWVRRYAAFDEKTNRIIEIIIRDLSGPPGVDQPAYPAEVVVGLSQIQSQLAAY